MASIDYRTGPIPGAHFTHPRVIEGSRTEGRGHDSVRGRIKGVGNLKYRVLTEVPKGPGARVLATERALHTKLDAVASALLEDRRGHAGDAEEQLERSIGVHDEI